MLFKKSLEEFYRENLFKSVVNCPDCQGYLPLNTDRYIAMSLLQKAIRRGDFGFAFSSALTLLNHNDRAFWKRMCVIVFEDIGIANTDLVGRVTIAVGDKRLRQKLGGDRIVATTLIWEMCNSEKDRSTDDLLEFVERAPVLEQVKDELAEMSLQERLGRVKTYTQPFSHQSTAALAAAVGLPSDPQLSRDRIACSTAYFESLVNNVLSGATVVESFIAREGDPDFVPLSWVVGVHVPDPLLWDDIKTGKLNGFSLEGMGIKEAKTVGMNIPDNFELNTSRVQDETIDCASSLLHQVFLDFTLLRPI